MEIELFTLCDFAEDMGNGKMVIVGTFDIIWATRMPATHPACSIAARIRVYQKDSGKHNLTISIKDSQGTQIVSPVEADFVAAITEEHESGVVSLTIGIGQLHLTTLGKHTVDLEIDGNIVKSLPFLVRQK